MTTMRSSLTPSVWLIPRAKLSLNVTGSCAYTSMVMAMEMLTRATSALAGSHWHMPCSSENVPVAAGVTPHGTAVIAPQVLSSCACQAPVHSEPMLPQ